jgi:hypothetical protein
VLCVKGFWGVRHHIEELIAGQTVGRDAAKELARPKKGLPVRLALDRAADDLLSTIAKGGATTQVAELTAGETLLALLWDSQTRPAILVVLGHLETAQKLQEPDYPRIHVRSEGSWLFAELISQTAQNKGRWDTGPLVELMSCGSGATDIETLNNLVLAFHDAGAAAVLGTECLVDATLAERFGGEVTAALLKGDSLGQAVTSFRRRLFAEGNPLAFVFNVIGSADLRMAP